MKPDAGDLNYGENKFLRTVFVLAGGEGSRIREVLPNKPKVLASIGKRTLLDYQLDLLEAGGFEKVVLATGHRSEAIEEHVGMHLRDSMRIEFSVESVPLGTGGALRLALDSHRQKTDFALLNGDTLFGVDFEMLRRNHLEKGALCTMALAEVQDTTRYGSVEISSNGAVRSFAEKGVRVGAGLINGGVYIFSKEISERFPDEGSFSLETDLLPLLIGKGLFGVRFEAMFIDIGTPEDYEIAREKVPEWFGVK